MKPVDFKGGLRAGMRAALGLPTVVLLGSLTGYGALTHDTGFGAGLAVLSTILVWGLPGQIVMSEMYAAGADVLAIAVAVGMANMRFFPMAVSLMPTLAGRNVLVRFAQAQLMSATSWAYVMRASAPETPEARLGYHTGFTCVCVSVAATATLIGYLGAAGLPKPLGLALLFINACFLLLLLLDTRGRGAAVAVITGVVAGIPINMYFPDTGLIITGLVGGTAGFLADGTSRKQAS
ncbi:MAG: AzlC family ABC transporter permease [Thalassobaculaceae bacterium]|nr:AzlC family ABC transporter permease [Thalassobaculaceae bacterium]